MIDLHDLGKYRENNRIEAKQALGGLPRSLWETYSAFANTIGGVILLGVRELPDQTLDILGLPDPDLRVHQFWEIARDPAQVSVNILSEDCVTIQTVDGKSIVVIEIPRARRTDKPVYVGGDPFTGTYRRNGEGDYHCTAGEVRGMLRDRSAQAWDRQPVPALGPAALDLGTVVRYQTLLPPGARFSGETEEFLYELNALGRDGSGTLHPTAAGLLMFGRAGDIADYFPGYHLDYWEQAGPDGAEYRLQSDSGGWTGNLLDFYLRVCERLAGPSKRGKEDSGVHQALREAVANALIHTNYHARQGISIEKRQEEILISNPGCLRISPDEAVQGGRADPRNVVLTQLFHLIRVGRRTGSGIPQIRAVWENEGWQVPQLTEQFGPDRVILSLPVHRLESTGGRGAAVLDYLTDHVQCSAGELARCAGLDAERTVALLTRLAADGLVEQGEDGTYRLTVRPLP